MFIKYPKIYRLGAEENEGILDGCCFIQEKIDGANTQVWLENGIIKQGTRNNEINEGFNGFVDYIQSNQGIKDLLDDYPTYRLYGEWLVRHTISYNELSYRNWYLFDILDNDKFLELPQVYELSKKYNILTPELFDVVTNPALEQLNKFVGKSVLGEKGEGIVIKNFGFINKFSALCYAKIVTETFKESNSIVFGGNNKHSEFYSEMYICNKFITLGRVQKILNKIEPELEEKFSMKHIPRIMETVYHDLWTEEAYYIAKNFSAINLKKLKDLCDKKSKQIYIEILNKDISVAHQI